MAFPANPTNGQTATVNNISYTYNSTTGAWVKTGSVATASPVSSVAGRTGAVTLTAADIGTGTMTGTLTVDGEIRSTNTVTAFYSDRRLKTEVAKIESALDKIDQLVGIIYTQNELAEQFGYNNYEEQVGVYAQDVERVQPQAVKPAPFDIAADGSSKSGENYLTVQYEKLIPLLIEGIKELRVEIRKLKGE